MVVNGVSWPYLDVAPERYRFRLLNGSNSRFLNLAMFVVADDGVDGIPGTNDDTLGQEVPFYQIGAEQSLLSKVTKVWTGCKTWLGQGQDSFPVGAGSCPAGWAADDPAEALLMGPAERADVIVDFNGLAPNTRIRLVNRGADAPFGGFPIDEPVDPDTTGQVMEFVVNRDSAGDPSTPPARLRIAVPEVIEWNTLPNGPTRDLALIEEESAEVCVEVRPNGVIRAIDLPGVGDFLAECLAAGGEPFAPKAAVLGTDGKTGGIAQLWSDPIRTNPVLNALEKWELYNYTMDAHPIHLHLVKYRVMSRRPFAFNGRRAERGRRRRHQPGPRGRRRGRARHRRRLRRVTRRADRGRARSLGRRRRRPRCHHRAGLTVGDATEAYSDSVAAGDVISQDPAAGTEVELGTAVSYVESLGVQTVAVPEVRGQSQEDATAAIEAADLTVGEVLERTNANVPAGAAVRTEPAMGEMVDIGSAVTLIMSKGPKQVEVPDVVGMTEADAIAAIEAAELAAGASSDEHSDSAPAGSVISTSPSAGSTVDANSAVDYVLSLGVEQVTVPQIIDLAEADAIAAIEAVGLAVGTVDSAFDEDIAVGNVSSQDPAAGSDVDKGSPSTTPSATAPRRSCRFLPCAICPRQTPSPPSRAPV